MTTDSARGVALVLLCTAGALGFEDYHPIAMALLICGAGLLLLAMRWPHARSGLRRGEWVALVAGLAVDGELAARHLGSAGAEAAAATTGLMAVAAVLLPSRAGRAAVGVAVAGLVATLALPWRWGTAMVDVFDIVGGAARELAHGINPYRHHTLLTWQELPTGRFRPFLIAFSYGPGMLLLALPFAVLGDWRPVCVLAAVAIVVGAITLARRSPVRPDSRLIAAVCIAFPLTAAMVDFAWVDLPLMGCVVAWLALRARHPVWACLALALALSIKPVNVVVLALPLVAWSRQARREAVAAGAAALALVVPFAAATGMTGFYDAVAGFFTRMTARSTGLTINAMLLQNGRPSLPATVGVVAVLATAVLVLRQRPRDLSDALWAGATLLTVAFLFAKWAFVNYYFDPAVILLLSLVTRGIPIDQPVKVAEVSAIWQRESLTPVAAAAAHGR